MIRQQLDRIDLSHLGSIWCVTGPDKCPRNATGNPLKVNRPEQWMDYRTALKVASEQANLTLGVMLNPMDDLHCVDFDGCLDPQGRITDPEIERFINEAQSYSEISLSGNGLHVFVRGSVDAKLPAHGSPEIYDGSSPRYIAVTGNLYQSLGEVKTDSGIIQRAVEMNRSTSAVPVTPNTPHSVVVSSQQAAVELCLKLISKNRCDDRNEWLRIAAAIKNSIANEALAYEIFDEWSQMSEHYEELENQHQWDSLVNPECELGTLIHAAREDSKVAVSIDSKKNDNEEHKGESLMQLMTESMFTLKSIPDDERVEWMADGLIARGHHTLLSGREKSGKSTLLGGLLKMLSGDEDGTYLGCEVTGGQKIMIISEETKAQWRQRRDQLGMTGSIYVCSIPFARPTQKQWKWFCEELAQKLEKEKFDLLIFDPIANFAPWSSENDAPEVTQALTSLNAIKKKGIAILSVHHAAKYSGESRGSTALTSNPDICLNLKYTRKRSGKDEVDATDSDDRILSGKGRFQEVPSRLLVAYDWGTHSYCLRDSAQTIQRSANERIVLAAIRDHDGPISRADLKNAIGDDISDSTRNRRLKELEAAGQIITSGSGEVGDAYMYEINTCSDDLQELPNI